MKPLNRIGPTIDPYGTPEITFRKSLLILLIHTHCFRFGGKIYVTKKAFIYTIRSKFYK